MAGRAVALSIVAAISIELTAHWAAAAAPVAYDPYTLGYVQGYRYVPYPVNEYPPPYKTPVYMYGYFGARPRREPIRNQAFNDYIRDFRRGYVW
jgi:hypothetical protein